MATRLSRVDPRKNMARWYEIEVQPTLFGEYTVERHWVASIFLEVGHE